MKIIAAFSGGVDSAVAAMLMKNAGHAVSAVFMRNWEDDDECSDRADFLAAAAAADVLGLDLRVVNFAEEYRARVFAGFLREFAAGRTPNPDVWCNAEIKFQSLWKFAQAENADAIATGHYAQIRNGRELIRAEDSAKDQSYFLHRLTQEQLSHAKFPLGEMRKSEVRKIARESGLPNWDKKDSVGICFIGKRPFREFLKKYLPPSPGQILTPEGKIVGEHEGLHFYTIGQRKGLAVGGGGGPWFVADKDREKNALIVVAGESHPLLFRSRIEIADAHWIAEKPPKTAWVFGARLRHRQPIAACTLIRADAHSAEIAFAEPQRAVAPGQFAVIYDGKLCLGGGIIQ